MTGIERAAKFFFPHRNIANKAAKFHAKKLHKLKSCPILIQYLTGGFISYQGQDITYLISDYVEGEVLEDFLNRQPGKKISPFQGLHLLHALARDLKTFIVLRNITAIFTVEILLSKTRSWI